MRRVFAVSLLFSLFSILPAAAATCPGTVVFQDSYTSPNPALSTTAYPQAKVAVQGGKAEIDFAQASFAYTEEYAGMQYGDANFCLTVATGANDKAENQLGGLVFWATDYSSYYVLLVNPTNGQFEVAQKTQGAWTSPPLPSAANAAVVQGMGKSNTLRVQTRGTTATIFINDQQVGTVTGTPPAGGGLAGFYAEAEASMTAPETWDYTNFSVSSPQTATATSSAACPGTVVFQDSFATPDPALNLTADANSAATTVGGKLQMQFMSPAYRRSAEYLGTQYGDADICAAFSEPATDKAEGQVAGIIFWSADYSNFYVFEVDTTSGEYDLAQMGAGKWIIYVGSAPSAVVEKGMGKTNTLRVQTKGSHATLYVNNQQVESLNGLPPAGGGLVGLYAESEYSMTAKETWNISGLTIAAP